MGDARCQRRPRRSDPFRGALTARRGRGGSRAGRGYGRPSWREAGAIEADKLWFLSKINLFTDLDRSALAALEGISPLRAIPSGDLFLRPGEASSALYLLKRGRVRLYRLLVDGHKVTLAILREGNVFGATDMVALGTEDMYAEAMDDVLICAMRREGVERLMAAHPWGGLRLIMVLSQRVRELHALMEGMAHQDVRRRLVHLLLHFTEDFGVADGDFIRVDAPVTHEDLATLIGSTRETVTTTLSRLSREGVVRARRRQVSVHRSKAVACLEAII